MRFINRHGLTLLLAAVVLTMSSCVSTRTRVLSQADMKDTRVIGSVNAKFKSFQWFHIPMSNSVADRAYDELMREAKRQYVGKNVDVVNIRISGTMSGGTIATLLLFWPLIIFGNGQIITALGDVILFDGSLPDRPERTPVKTYAAQTEIDKPKG